VKELEQLEKSINETVHLARSTGRWQVAAWVSVIVMVAVIIWRLTQ
jgi:hypothetical protein